MGGQYLNSSYSLPCPPGLDIPPETFSPLTSNVLKFLLLLGCLSLFGSVYYLLEVALAHADTQGLCGSIEDGAELEDTVPFITPDTPTIPEPPPSLCSVCQRCGSVNWLSAEKVPPCPMCP